jgi:hypothetical protein
MEVASFLREKDLHQDYAVVQSGRSEYPGSEKHLNQGIFLLANSYIFVYLTATYDNINGQRQIQRNAPAK